jgi:hypothetical protein
MTLITQLPGANHIAANFVLTGETISIFASIQVLGSHPVYESRIQSLNTTEIVFIGARELVETTKAEWRV